MAKAFVQRDTAVTGKYYVEAEGGSGGGGGVSYSTEEQDTGLTWIDGKKIYQKTVEFGTLPNASSKEVAHDIVGFETIWIKEFICVGSNDYYTILPYVLMSAGTHGGELYLHDGKIHVTVDGNFSSYTGYCTICYTKIE